MPAQAERLRLRAERGGVDGEEAVAVLPPRGERWSRGGVAGGEAGPGTTRVLVAEVVVDLRRSRGDWGLLRERFWRGLEEEELSMRSELNLEGRPAGGWGGGGGMGGGGEGEGRTTANGDGGDHQHQRGRGWGGCMREPVVIVPPSFVELYITDMVIGDWTGEIIRQDANGGVGRGAQDGVDGAAERSSVESSKRWFHVNLYEYY